MSTSAGHQGVTLPGPVDNTRHMIVDSAAAHPGLDAFDLFVGQPGITQRQWDFKRQFSVDRIEEFPKKRSRLPPDR